MVSDYARDHARSRPKERSYKIKIDLIYKIIPRQIYCQARDGLLLKLFID
jgi:hypothetical protein